MDKWEITMVIDGVTICKTIVAESYEVSRGDRTKMDTDFWVPGADGRLWIGSYSNVACVERLKDA